MGQNWGREGRKLEKGRSSERWEGGKNDNMRRRTSWKLYVYVYRMLSISLSICSNCSDPIDNRLAILIWKPQSAVIFLKIYYHHNHAITKS